jgi:penicillin-binding protein 1A
LVERKQPRIDPEFDHASSRRDEGDMRAHDEDRPVPKAKKNSKSVQKRSSLKNKKRTSSYSLLSKIRRFFYWMFVLSIWGFIGIIALVAYYGAKMPSATTWAIPARAPNVKIVANDGFLISNRGINGGEALGLHEMSPYIPQAVVAIEDRRFYSHFGFDPIGFVRAMVRNIISLKMVQGGSTLTQQLAKNLFLKPDRTLERKVQEMLLALWMEQKYSKEQILEMYLNRVYFGSGATGVEAAARRYFNKSARYVSLTQAATLAAVLKAPTFYSPANNSEAANKRANLVLNAMRAQGMISDKELGSAQEKPITKAAAYWNSSEQFVADRVMSELKDILKDVKIDVIVDTTIDLNMQQVAQKAIEKRIEKSGKKLNVSQGALVSIDKTGAIKAYVGGVDYAQSQYDRVGTAKRQAGSTFKPFVYLAALERGQTPETVRNDAPITIGNWRPENYEDKYFGDVTLAVALSKSLNSIAAQLVMETSPEAVIEVAHRLGVVSKIPSNLGIALGTSDVNLLEMTGAYSVFSNGGNKTNVHLIKRVTDLDGKMLFETKQSDNPPVIKSKIVGMMNAMLKRTLTEGTAQKAQFGFPAAGKTGTTQSFKDAWFIGYSAHLTTGVWFGNDDNSAMNKVTGGSLPATAFKEFMTKAHEGLPKAELAGTWNFTPERTVETPSPIIQNDLSPNQNAPVTDTLLPPAQEDQSGRPIPSIGVGEQGKISPRKSRNLFDVLFGR